ncbi:MAG: FecR family protein, partial [Treponema sp.]|nr:FecR family protein [Treponema sp.]
MRTSISLFFDAVVAALCCAAAALCVYYFRLDFYQTLSRQNEEPVGIITYKYKAVQRRFVDRLLWDRLQRESPVYNGDFIRTEDLSEATVFFSGGGIVDLAENSLIQIFARDSAPQLQVSEGGVSVNARNSDFVISSGGNTVTVDSGAVVSTRTNPGGTLGLWVNEGRAVVSTAEGVHEAQAGSALSLNQDGNVDSAPLTAVLSPRPGARLISRRQSGLSVEFAFKPVNYNNAELTRLEISASRDFEEKILSRELEAHRLVVELPPGLWWWRAYPVKGPQDKAPASAAAGKLAVLYVSPPTLYAPADGQVFVFRANHPPVRYRWSEASDAHAAQYYLLEVADNPDFRQPELRTQIRGSSALSSQAGPGRWYWRVTPGFPAEYEGQPEASEVFSFVMEQRDEFPAPSLTAPAEGSLISIARNREDLWFSWKSSAELESYTLRISENRD